MRHTAKFKLHIKIIIKSKLITIETIETIVLIFLDLIKYCFIKYIKLK